MPNLMNESEQGVREVLRPVHWLFLVSGLAVYLILRLPWVGHLLMWDEAMNLCSVRSFVARGQDFYLSWFWHHPPLMGMAMSLLHPLQSGFAERSQLLFLLFGILNCLALFALSRSTFGTRVALWAVFFYAVMPAAIFFDLWLKQDPLVAPFGLLSLYAFLSRRSLLAGAFLAISLLVKEVAVIFAIGVGILWLLRPRESRRIRDLVWFAGAAAALSGWWYLRSDSPIWYFLALAIDSTSQPTDAWVWARPWYYYLVKLWVDLGLVGILGSVTGVVVIGWLRRNCRHDEFPAIAWPLAVLVPAFILFSAARAKTVWFPVPLYPMFAALQAIGLSALLVAGERWLMRIAERSPWLGAWWPRWIARAVALSVIVVSTSSVWGRDYERYLYAQDGGIWWGAAASRQAAERINGSVKDGQKALITPMSYWQYRDKEPCPIFVYYLKDIPVLVRPYDLSAQELVEAVREYQLDWAMVSPEGSVARAALLEPLIRDCGVLPVFLQGTCIFRTDSIYKKEANPPSESRP